MSPDTVTAAHAVVQGAGAAGEVRIRRTLRDGAYVVTHAEDEESTFFDVFRFADGRIAEHRHHSAPIAPPNRSGHTQTDGPTEPDPATDSEASKALVRNYYEQFHLAGRHSGVAEWFLGDYCVRHEPGVADGVQEFARDVAVLSESRTIDALELLVGEGDFVFLLALGTHAGLPCRYIDLYRVADGKLVEHWGFFD